jgi:hypothetical protein
MNLFRTLLTSSALLLGSSLALAHPGHGLGSLGHALDHAIWNFLGVAAGAAALMLVARLPASARRRRDENDRD